MENNAELVANFCLGVQLSKSSIKRNAFWYNTTVITAMTYGLLTLLVNFRVYTVLLRNRKMKDFSSTFYTVFIIASVVDSCWWVSNQLKDHVGLAPAMHFMLGWIPSTGLVISLWFFILVNFMYIDMLITVLVSFNRFLTMVFPNGVMIWKKVFPFGLLIVFLLPLVFTWDIWLNNVVICTIENNGNLYFYINQLNEFAYGIQINLGEFSVALSTAIINAILNLSTILSVVCQRKQVSNNHGSKKTFKCVKGPEIMLLIISCIMFVNQCSYSSIQLLFFINKFVPNPDRYAVIFEVSRFVIDFMCLSPIWILLIVNKRLRKITFPTFVSTASVSVKSIHVRSQKLPDCLKR